MAVVVAVVVAAVAVVVWHVCVRLLVRCVNTRLTKKGVRKDDRVGGAGESVARWLCLAPSTVHLGSCDTKNMVWLHSAVVQL